LTDRSGHIDLFPQPHSKTAVTKNPEVEKEAARKKKEYEDQFTMRFSNAAGFKTSLDAPWYSTSSKVGNTSSAVPETDMVGAPGKDVWGNADPRRKEREAARIVADDPLAMMRRGAAGVRKVEKERKRWAEERQREVGELIAEEKRKVNKKRRHGEVDELEGFSLDKQEGVSSRREEKRSRHGESHRRSHRERSRERVKERDRDRDRDRNRDEHRRHHRH
jgi:hypothetical protein